MVIATQQTTVSSAVITSLVGHYAMDRESSSTSADAGSREGILGAGERTQAVVITSLVGHLIGLFCVLPAADRSWGLVFGERQVSSEEEMRGSTVLRKKKRRA